MKLNYSLISRVLWFAVVVYVVYLIHRANSYFPPDVAISASNAVSRSDDTLVPLTRTVDQLRLGLTKPIDIISQPVNISLLGRRCTETASCFVCIFSAIYREDPYLREWITYHLLHGVDHFFLADMFPRSYSTAAVLDPFIRAGQVTLVHRHALWAYGIPRLMEQIDAIRMVLDTYRHLSEWSLVLDVDEFFVSEKFGSVPAAIAAHEAQPNATDILRIPWYNFGPGGVVTRPASTIGAYTIRTPDMVYDVERYIYGRHNGKAVYRSACWERLFHPHDAWLDVKLPVAVPIYPAHTDDVEGGQRITAGSRVPPAAAMGAAADAVERGVPMRLRNCRNGTRPDPATTNPGYHLNHYHTKSYQDFVWKRGKSGFTGLRSDYVKMRNAGGYWNSIQRNYPQEWGFYGNLFCCDNDTSLVDASAVLQRRMLTEVAMTHAEFASVPWADEELRNVDLRQLVGVSPAATYASPEEKRVDLRKKVEGHSGL